MYQKILVALFFIQLTSVVKGQTSYKEDSLKIMSLINRFQEAIHSKDSVAFSKLFFHSQTSFIGIMSPKTEQKIKEKNPEFIGVSISNSLKFISEIVSAKYTSRENIYNINISLDGKIASVRFIYSFLKNDQISQWGVEKWNLVFTENEWFVTDVIYSIHYQKIEPFDEESKKVKPLNKYLVPIDN